MLDAEPHILESRPNRPDLIDLVDIDDASALRFPVYSERLPETGSMHERPETVPSVKATIEGCRGHNRDDVVVNSGHPVPSGTISLEERALPRV